jgi:heptosyltransferase-1
MSTRTPASASAQQAVPRRILIVRLSALGDIVMASGLIPALKTAYPDAEVSWLCEASCAPLLKHNPGLKQVLIWPRTQWEQLLKAKQYLALWREVRQFRTMLREQQFDLVLDGQGLLKSGLLAWFTGAPRRVSIIAREGSHRLVHEVVTPPPGADPVMGSEYRYLAYHLGAPAGSFMHDLAVGEAPRARARQVLAEALRACADTVAPAQAPRPLVVLCPFTTRPQKHWVEAHWTELAQALWRDGLQPVVLGGPSNFDAAARIVAQLPQVPSLAGALKLDESVALIADAQLLVGVDTGLTHMGTALRVPTLALFGSTRPYLQGPTPMTRVMYDALPCSPCRRRPTCDGAFTCMKQLTVARVHLQALALLAVLSPRSSLEGGVSP